MVAAVFGMGVHQPVTVFAQQLDITGAFPANRVVVQVMHVQSHLMPGTVAAFALSAALRNDAAAKRVPLRGGDVGVVVSHRESLFVMAGGEVKKPRPGACVKCVYQ